MGILADDFCKHLLINANYSRLVKHRKTKNRLQTRVVRGDVITPLPCLSIYLPLRLNPRRGASDGYSGIPSAEGVS